MLLLVRLAGVMEMPQSPPCQRLPFGALLRHYRTVAGLTQEELAERAGLSVRNLRSLERGAPQRPHHTTIERLAAALALEEADHTSFTHHARCQGRAHPRSTLHSAGAAPPFAG